MIFSQLLRIYSIDEGNSESADNLILWQTENKRNGAGPWAYNLSRADNIDY